MVRLSYLGVRLGDLLVQALVAVDGQLQLLHLRRQASFAADLTPGLHLRQELEGNEAFNTDQYLALYCSRK